MISPESALDRLAVQYAVTRKQVDACADDLERSFDRRAAATAARREFYWDAPTAHAFVRDLVEALRSDRQS